MESRSGRLPVDSTSSTSSTSGSTSPSGVPGSVSGSSMIPEWSLPSSTSSSARIIPSESSPRTLRCSSCRPPGSFAPGSATATVAPAPKFHAPQTIWRGSPSPTSTRVSCSRSAFGCLIASSTRPTRKRPRLPSSSGRPRPSIPSTSAVEIESRSASSGSGISSGTYSRSHETGTRITDHLGRRSRSPAAKTKRRKDAGSVRSRRLRARLRTPRGAGLQPPGECEMRARGSALKLVQDPEVPLPQCADVREVVLQLRHPLDPAAEREAAPLLRIDAHVLEHTWVDHPGATHLEPARVAARPAARAAADPARDVRLHRWLGEREVVRAEANAPVGPEDRPHHVQQRPLQVGERDVPVDGEALELVEDRVVRRVDVVAAVSAPDRDHVDRRLALLQREDLRRRGLRPQQPLVVEEEGRAVRARRMPRVEGELVEVELDRLDLAVVPDLVAEPEEGVLDLTPGLRDRVEVPERQRVAREGDVDDVFGQRALELGALEGFAPLRERRLEPVAQRVERHPGLAVAHGAQRLGQLALAAEVADARLLQLGGARRARDRALRLGFQGLGVHRATVPSALVDSLAASLYDSIAELYDPWSVSVTEDVGFYVEEAERAGSPVVELAVGTGRIAVPTAAAGVRVIGIDSSPGMLDVCRRRAEAAGVSELLDLRLGELEAPPVDERVGLVTCPFRSFLHLGDEDARLRALRAARELLLPGGRLVFDVFAPSAEDIADTHGRWLEREPGIFERADWDAEARTLTLSVRGASGATSFVLAWLSNDEWWALLEQAGFQVVACYGWFDRRPHAGGEDTVWVARKPA